MQPPKFVDEVAGRLSELISQGPARDLERNVKAMLSSAFSRLDLVTREEFEVQRELLMRTREKLDALEQRIAVLEAASKPGDNPSGS